MRVGYEKIAIFLNHFISEMIQDKPIITVERQQESCAIYRMVPFSQPTVQEHVIFCPTDGPAIMY